MRKLGRGLSELGLNELLSAPGGASYLEIHNNAQLRQLPIAKVFPGQYQPRKHIDQESLKELADSIRAQGVIQPILVSPIADHCYEIIAGERRWRAATMAGLTEIPAIVRQISPQTAVAFALIENIQRQDLNALEEAQSLQRLLQEFNLTHDAVAQAVGKSRAAVSNLLRLLELTEEVKNLLSMDQIQMGHARALLTLAKEDQYQLAQQVVAKSLSVRQTEVLVRDFAKNKLAPAKLLSLPEKNMQQLQTRLAEKLGVQVLIRHNAKGKGKIVINYHNLEKLASLVDLLGI